MLWNKIPLNIPERNTKIIEKSVACDEFEENCVKRNRKTKNVANKNKPRKENDCCHHRK